VDGEVIRAALAELPKRMRAAVVLRHWLDLSVEETASLLDCSEGTVKSQTAKGIARLRSLLGGGGSGAAAITTRTGSMLPAEGS
jgi:RNA polymerase sigma factor (sigma-70 family)